MRKCKKCGKEIVKLQNISQKAWAERYKYCSISCSKKDKPSWNKGKPRTWKSPGDFKKGYKPWNSGTKGIMKAWNKGKKWSSEVKKKMSGRRNHVTNEKNHNWKGDKVSYHGAHVWVKRHLGHAEKCRDCGAIGKKKNGLWTIHWANKDHKYRRNLEDYIPLCPKCHKKFDLNR
jgi:hypothetical protein